MSLLKIKHGTVKVNKDAKKLSREDFLTLQKSRDIISTLKKKGYDGAAEELQSFIRSTRKANFTVDKETPVTFYREVKGLGKFEFTGVKTADTNIMSLYKQASDFIKKQVSDARSKRKAPHISYAHVNHSGEAFQLPKIGTDAVRNLIDIGYEKDVKDGKVKFKKNAKLIGTGKRLEESTITGGVFAEPGSIMKILKYKYSLGIFDNKAPKDNKNYVGIELEFFCDVDRKILAIDFYEAGLTEYLSLTTDGSLRPPKGKHPHELRILCHESDVEKVVRGVCKILKKHNAQVNKSCGTHVHLDMRQRDRAKVFANLAKAQKILYKMNPKSRKTGEYSKPVETNDLEKELANITAKYPNGERQHRYGGINAAALRKFNTLEIRMHAGMVDPDKIVNWVKLLTHITNLDEIVPDYKTTLGFFKKFEIPSELREYVLKRMEITKEGELEVEEAA